MINELIISTFRKSDDVRIKITTAASYINRTTREILPELPEGVVEAEWARLSTFVRNDRTGDIYEIAHDIEDTTDTYTEVYLTPDSYCDIAFGTTVGGIGYSNINQNVYPEYKPGEIYAEGDMVTYKLWTWVSDFDENTGNTPDVWGWSPYLPFAETREAHYATYEELYGEG